MRMSYPSLGRGRCRVCRAAATTVRLVSVGSRIPQGPRDPHRTSPPKHSLPFKAFKGRARVGMGSTFVASASSLTSLGPHPSPNLPLKGEELSLWREAPGEGAGDVRHSRTTRLPFTTLTFPGHRSIQPTLSAVPLSTLHLALPLQCLRDNSY